MDFNFQEFRTEEFKNFSFENLIGYYNYLRLIPIQYLLNSVDEFKSCVHEMLERRIDILSLQSKMPSSRTQDEAEKATNLFLNEFFSLTATELFEEAQSNQAKPIVRSLPKTTGEKMLKQYTQLCLQFSKDLDRWLKNTNKLTVAAQRIAEKSEKATKSMKLKQTSLFE